MKAMKAMKALKAMKAMKAVKAMKAPKAPMKSMKATRVSVMKRPKAKAKAKAQAQLWGRCFVCSQDPTTRDATTCVQCHGLCGRGLLQGEGQVCFVVVVVIVVVGGADGTVQFCFSMLGYVKLCFVILVFL